MKDRFKATTQHQDWEGTAAADDKITSSIWDYLESEKLVEDGEFLVAVSMSLIEGHPYIAAYVHQGGPSGDFLRDEFAGMDGPIPTREIRLSLSFDDILKLFQQFSVVLARTTLEVVGKEYQFPE